MRATLSTVRSATLLGLSALFCTATWAQTETPHAPVDLLKPVIVDKSNWKQTLVDSGYYKASQF